MRKDLQIYIEGWLRTRDYEKEVQNYYITEIMVDEMLMLDNRCGASGGDSPHDDIQFKVRATGWLSDDLSRHVV